MQPIFIIITDGFPFISMLAMQGEHDQTHNLKCAFAFLLTLSVPKMQQLTKPFRPLFNAVVPILTKQMRNTISCHNQLYFQINLQIIYLRNYCFCG